MKPIRWGVIGTANIFTKRLLPAMQHSEMADMYAVASRTPEKAEKTARENSIPVWFGSYEELLRDESIEAVYIPLPNHLHTEWTKKAADAGKHVLCEKPFALTAGEAEAAIDYAHSKGVLFMEAFMYRFHPQWIKVKELIKTGEIGEVRAVQSLFSYNLPDPKNIRNVQKWGGGGLMDIGCYSVSSARFVMDREPLRAVSLINRDPGFGTDVITSGVLDFSGAHAVFTVSTLAKAFQTMTVLGTGGSIEIDIPYNAFHHCPVTVTLENGLARRTIALGPFDQYQLMVEAFGRAIRNGDTAPTNPEDAVMNQKAMDALFASEKSGKWEAV